MPQPMATRPEEPTTGTDRPIVTAVDLGRVPYDRALELQRRLALAKKRSELSDDLLLLVEHPPVVTLGRGSDRNHLSTPVEALLAHGVACVEIERGGDVTYHGPGQLVGYPILDLGGFRRDLHWYLRRVEETVIRALARFDLPAFRVDGYTGVWVGDPERAEGDPERGAGASGGRGTPESPRTGLSSEAARPLIAAASIRKIASIGVHVSRWVTWHGFALNLTDESLEPFEWIVPCGIPGVRMTSVEAEGRAVERAEAARAVLGGFAEAFGADVQTAARLPALEA